MKNTQKIQGVEPITNATVRYDTSAKAWIQIDLAANRTVKKLKRGYMTNVTFERALITEHTSGCGGTRSHDIYIGVAKGTLCPDVLPAVKNGALNLGFDQDLGFLSGKTKKPLKNAKELFLMDDRKALYFTK